MGLSSATEAQQLRDEKRDREHTALLEMIAGLSAHVIALRAPTTPTAAEGTAEAKTHDLDDFVAGVKAYHAALAACACRLAASCLHLAPSPHAQCSMSTLSIHMRF
mmetsp:Transcript_28231/g.86260  ORF Transcript_28231/g.86260 Transcript_28231/m.86260 type:complete len:106 (+) Transcript_28231:540-857(+)